MKESRTITVYTGTSSPSPPVDASAFNAQFEGASQLSLALLGQFFEE